jgi:hypothetical protein
MPLLDAKLRMLIILHSNYDSKSTRSRKKRGFGRIRLARIQKTPACIRILPSCMLYHSFASGMHRGRQQAARVKNGLVRACVAHTCVPHLLVIDTTNASIVECPMEFLEQFSLTEVVSFKYDSVYSAPGMLAMGDLAYGRCVLALAFKAAYKTVPSGTTSFRCLETL